MLHDCCWMVVAAWPFLPLARPSVPTGPCSWGSAALGDLFMRPLAWTVKRALYPSWLLSPWDTQPAPLTPAMPGAEQEQWGDEGADVEEEGEWEEEEGEEEAEGEAALAALDGALELLGAAKQSLLQAEEQVRAGCSLGTQWR